MTSVVLIPAPLRAYVGGCRQIAVHAATVEGALLELTEKSAALRRHLLDDDGQLRHFVSVFVNDEDIRALAGPATPLAEGDAILLVPAIAGGAGGAG
jgi:molybdopterin converting factor small subunit